MIALFRIESGHYFLGLAAAPLGLSYRVSDWIWVFVALLVLQAATIAWLARSIRIKRRAERELRDSLALLRATIESTDEGILVLDRQKRMLAHNRRYMAMYGLPPDWFEQGLSEREAFFDEIAIDGERVRQRFEHLLANPDEEATDRVELKDGRTIERRARPYRVGDRTIGSLFTYRDVTENVNSERERRLRETRSRQAQMMQSIGALAGGIAHEYNNLLMAILGNADLALMNVEGDSRPAKALKSIREAGWRAAGLTRQMLAYAGQSQFILESIDAVQLIRGMDEALRASAAGNVRFRVEFESEALPMLADRTQMRQAIHNLVANACEAIGEAEGTVAIRAGSERLGRAQLNRLRLGEDAAEGEYVFIEVKDTGAGMDEDTLQRLFDPFFTTKFTGRGLGLAALLGIVRGHKGAIDVASQRGAGATFRMHIPKAAEKGATVGRARPAQPAAAGKTALVVDDEALLRDLATQLLERSGYSVIVAADGLEAVDLFRKHADEIDVVLLDLAMPRMDGPEALRIMRQIRPDAPVVMTSGYAEQEAATHYGGLGVKVFLQKPYEAATLLEKLDEALRNE